MVVRVAGVAARSTSTLCRAWTRHKNLQRCTSAKGCAIVCDAWLTHLPDRSNVPVRVAPKRT